MGILKVIGILLLCIIALILFIVLSVLFVPVRYQMDAAKKEKYHVYAKVHWFLHFIQAEFFWDGKSPEIKVRLLGLQLSQYKRLFEKIKKRRVRKKRVRKKKPVQETRQTQEIQIQSIESKTEESKKVLEEVEEIQEKKSIQPLNEAEMLESIESLEEPKVSRVGKVWEKICHSFSKVFGVLRSIPQKIRNFKNKIVSTVQKIKSAFGKASEWKNYLKSQEFRSAFGLVKKELFWMLKKIKPRKVKGELSFGFEDPSYTGELLGLFGIFYPLYGKNISIYPDFTKSLFEGEIFLKGRIHFVIILKIAWVLYRDKNIKNVIHKFRA